MAKNNVAIKKEQILTALKAVAVSGRDTDIVSAHMVKGLAVDEGRVIVTIAVDPAQGTALEDMRQAAEKTVRGLDGVTEATVVLTAERAPKSKRTPDPHGMDKNPKLDLPIKHIIAVASGKGGVGKSTVAFNLAVALAQQGLNVGLLDADIYGPSVPKLAGIPADQKPQTNENKKLMPHEAHGIKLMSMGFMVAEEKAMIWRGPMVQTAIYQMLRDVAWGTDKEPLDILVVDMPPGTGDAQLTLAQKVPLSGAVIVSTPQDLALIDARKGIGMFEKVDVPVLGLIENMSTHICSSCGHEEHIFGHGGAAQEAKARGVPFLGAIPLSMTIREASDAGVPVASPQSTDQKSGDLYKAIAGKLGVALHY